MYDFFWSILSNAPLMLAILSIIALIEVAMFVYIWRAVNSRSRVERSYHIAYKNKCARLKYQRKIAKAYRKTFYKKHHYLYGN